MRSEKAFGFARVSSEEQARGGISLGLQNQAIAEYCERAGLELVKTWQVAETATFRHQRKEFRAMLAQFAGAEDVPHLVFYKVDRSSRNIWDQARLQELVEERGKHLHAAHDNTHLHADSPPSEWDRFDLMGMFSRSETRHLSARVKSCIQAQTAQGFWSYKAPPGYRKLPRAGIEPDPRQAPLVRRLLELAATGEYSLDRLTKEAALLGISYQGKPLSRSAVHRWLADPIFAGPFYSKGKLITNYRHEPLISWAVHEKIRERLCDYRRSEKKIKDPQPLAGIFSCGRCGGQISFYRVKGKYSYGFCSSCKRSKRKHPHTEQTPILEKLGDVVQAFAITPEVGQLLRSWLEEDRHLVNDRLEAQTSALKARIDQLKKKLLRAFEALSEGLVDEETYRAQTAQWRAEKDDLEIEMRSLLRGEQEEKWDHVLEAFELAQGAEEIWEFATAREKAKMAKIVCSNLALTDGTVEFSLAFPFGDLAEGNGGQSWRALADAYRTASSDFAWKPTQQRLLLEELLAV